MDLATQDPHKNLPGFLTNLFRTDPARDAAGDGGWIDKLGKKRTRNPGIKESRKLLKKFLGSLIPGFLLNLFPPDTNKDTVEDGGWIDKLEEKEDKEPRNLGIQEIIKKIPGFLASWFPAESLSI